MLKKTLRRGALCFQFLAILNYQASAFGSGKDFCKSEFDDVIFSDDVIFESEARSKLECSRQCSNQRCCVTFTLDAIPVTSKWRCRGHSSYMTSQQGQSPVPGARSYILRKPNVLPRTCAEAKQMGQNCSAVHTLNISSQFSALEAVCDEDWTVILRCQNSSVDFYRGWTDYVNGFGDLDGAFWLGLEAIHQMTSNTRHDLRVELEDWDDVKATAEYSGFSLSSASNNYTLFFQSFVGGDAGDSLSPHKGIQFSTKDRDNDQVSGSPCAPFYRGAWWFTACHHSHLFGEFKSHNPTDTGLGIQWDSWKGSQYSLKFAQMMVRPAE